MVRNINRTAIAILALTLLFVGCRTSQEVVQPKEEKTVDLAALIAGYQAITPDTASLQHISGNAALSLRVNGNDINLKGKLRIKRGEGVQITITPLGLIEAASIEFLPQKVRLINKLTKKYTEVPYSEAPAIGLAGINYKVLEAIFLDYAFLPDGRLAYKGLRELAVEDRGTQYHVTTKGNSAMRYSFLIDKNSGYLVSMNGNSSTGESIKCDYADYAGMGNVSYPNDICINFKGDTNIRLGFDLSKTNNKAFNFSSRNINSSYRKQSIDDFLKSLK